ncbi:hypothetical protein CHL76_10490 [Marinococcus halophilus]|uniref:Uncharacterized protein n=1 Tax=Marinococcus halophilus TaxID=1371 RepID=A0A510Y644_MARHA|nr:DUF2512 family protein [Marinococcus halophilus]OZT79813.1 hypothetical protein CHL76_10490 [Marinococcus halophilus]GEK58633.1 hypothetical protein MHA01_15380 [Marinococcus halophilus]
MPHLLPLFIKFVAMAVSLGLLLGAVLSLLPGWTIVLLAVVLTLLSYGGDLMMIPRVKNPTAVLAGIGLVFVLVLLTVLIFTGNSAETWVGAVIAGVIVGAFEYPYHNYLRSKIMSMKGNSLVN